VDTRLEAAPSKELVDTLRAAEQVLASNDPVPMKHSLPVYVTKSFEQRRKKAGQGATLRNEAKRLVLTAVLADIPWSRVRV
jgi:hypothetical protein